jgi:SAM-dependent methyltransferase
MNGFSNPLDRWNDRFSGEDYLFGLEPNQYLKEKILYETNLPKRVRPKTLCIADGEGRNSVWLAQQGHDVSAFDFSPVAVEKAKKLAKNKSVTIDFNCCGWEDFDWKQDTYDFVIGIFFQFVEPLDRDKLFKLLSDSLKVGGVLLIQGYGLEQLKYNTGGPGKLDHLYDEKLLTNYFYNYKIIDLQTYTAEINEGSAHNGTSSLVGMTAIKLNT